MGASRRLPGGEGPAAGCTGVARVDARSLAPPRSGRRSPGTHPWAARCCRSPSGPRPGEPVSCATIAFQPARIDLEPALGGDVDQDSVVPPRVPGEEGAERPRDVLQGRLPLGPVRQEKDVVRFQPRRADEELMKGFSARDGIRRACDRGAVSWLSTSITTAHVSGLAWAEAGAQPASAARRRGWSGPRRVPSWRRPAPRR